MEKMQNSKKIIMIPITVLIILGLALFIVLIKDSRESVNGLDVVYKNSSDIVIENIVDDFSIEKEIIVTNSSSKLKTYSLEWVNLENKFKEQTNLLYTIEGDGKRVGNLEKSQVPGVSSVIFNSVAIEPGVEHIYKINIWYDGDIKYEKGSTLSGKIKVMSGSKES